MDIKLLFNEALLAQAAYATNLSKEMSESDLIDELLEVLGVTQTQAEYFVSKYKVVEQYSIEETGFSATLFLNKDTLEYHLATRGSAGFSFTEPDWIDANADNFLYGISYDQVTDLLNFYLRLITPSADPLTKSTAQFIFKQEQSEAYIELREAA